MADLGDEPDSACRSRVHLWRDDGPLLCGAAWFHGPMRDRDICHIVTFCPAAPQPKKLAKHPRQARQGKACHPDRAIEAYLRVLNNGGLASGVGDGAVPGFRVLANDAVGKEMHEPWRLAADCFQKFSRSLP